MADTKPVVEEIKEETPAVPEIPPRQISRAEAKARAAFEKAGLERVGVRFAKLKRAGATFNMTQVDVFVHKPSKTYVIFGNPQYEDPTAQFAQNAAPASTEDASVAATAAAAGETVAEELKAETDAAEVDATGIEETDIDLVVNQAECTREAAIKAIRENNNDVVSAIMALGQ